MAKMTKMTLNEFEQMLSDSVDATVREQDKAKALREELERCAAERQHWINVAAKMGNHEARALATEGWTDA